MTIKEVRAYGCSGCVYNTGDGGCNATDTLQDHCAEEDIIYVEEPQDYNEGHLHEAMDRTHVIITMICNVLDQHPAIEHFGLQDDVDQISYQLATLYSKLGEHDV